MTTYDAAGNPSIAFADIVPGNLVHIVFQYFDGALGPGHDGGTLEHYTQVRTKGSTSLVTWEGWETPIETGWIDPSHGQVTYYLIGAAAPTEPALGSVVQGITGAVYQRLGTDPATSTWGKAGDATTRTWTWLQTNEAPLVSLTQVVGA